MIAMAAVNLGLLVLSETKVLPFAWSWLVILGTVGTVCPGGGLTPLLSRTSPPR